MNELSIVNLKELEKVVSSLISESLEGLSSKKSNNEIEYIKTGDVLKMLKISKPTLIDWRKRGVIPSYRIGSQIRFVKSEIIDCVEKVQTIKYRS